MNSGPKSAPFRSAHDGIAVWSVWAVVIGILCGLAPPAGAQSPPDLAHSGQWSPAPTNPPIPSTLKAVHLALP